jgi:hydroxymethylbilane synthase
VPVGVSSSLKENEPELWFLEMTACVTSLDGSNHVEMSIGNAVKTLQDAENLGERLAKMLMESGAKAILDDITKDRESFTE